MKTTVQQNKAIATPVLTLQADAKGRLPKTIEVARIGYWRTPWHGTFELTTADFDEAEMHFNAGVHRVNGTEPLPATLDHLGGDTPAAFRMTRIYREGEKLMADIIWTQLGKEKMERDEYRYVSFEYCTRVQPYINPENEDDVLVNVVTGATLTNDPLFKKLKPVLASARSGTNNEGANMNLAELLAKNIEDLTDEEKAFINDHAAELTEEQRTKYGVTLEEEEDEETAEEKAAREAKEAEEEAARKEAEQLKASTKGMSKEQKAEYAKLRASVKALEADAKAGREAQQELLRNKLTASVKAHVDRGAVKSDQLEEAVNILMASTDAGRTRLSTFLSGLPSNQLIASAESGSGGGSDEEPVELTDEEKQLADDFGNTPEEIEAYKKAQADKKG